VVYINRHLVINFLQRGCTDVERHPEKNEGTTGIKSAGVFFWDYVGKEQKQQQTCCDIMNYDITNFFPTNNRTLQSSNIIRHQLFTMAEVPTGQPQEW
jgi:hypothetical protein